MTREVTNKLLGAIDEGILDPQSVVVACMKYMSEDDVAEMVRINELLTVFDEDE